MSEKGGISREGDMGVIRIPMSEIQGLRVAIQPCPCKGSKSKSTAEIRDRLDKGLAKLQAMK